MKLSKSIWYWRKALELLDIILWSFIHLLTNYLFMQIAVKFKCCKNLGAIQLRKDAFEIIAGVKNIDCCCLFLLSDYGATAGNTDWLCTIRLHTARVCASGEYPHPSILSSLCNKEHVYTLQGRFVLGEKFLYWLAFRNTHFVRRSYFEIMLSNHIFF